MKRIAVFVLLLLAAVTGIAQQRVTLSTGILTIPANINDRSIKAIDQSAKKIDNQSWLLATFTKLPSVNERRSLSREGIELLQFISPNAYIVSVSKSLSSEMLKRSGVSGIAEIPASYKIHPALPATLSGVAAEVIVACYPNLQLASIERKFQEEGISITGRENALYNIFQVSLTKDKLYTLASLPFVWWIEPLPPPAIELNANTRITSRANVLQSALPGDLGLTGEGVTIGVGEVNPVQGHIDYRHRFVGATSLVSPFNNYHATHVHGILAGAGNVNELYKGFAPKANTIPLQSSNTVSGGSVHSNNNLGMVLSNNSYVNGSPCYADGYSLFQFLADKNSWDFDHVLHVTGSGNSGESPCAGYPSGYRTVLSGLHTAKSMLSVGSLTRAGDLASYSSRGPGTGGIIKPEIVANGTNVISTTPTNTYGNNSGTSMSSPAVAGGLALLYQLYRRLNNGKNPSGALMKALICNTATDLGAVGPDYNHGFGSMNLLRAAEALQSRTYIQDSITHQSAKTHALVIPAGVSQLKVMLYWTDPPAGFLAQRALVHDLDLEVADPSSTLVLPYILDTLPASVANLASRGKDHINNIEQVVIDKPAAGTYQLKVIGTSVGQFPQQKYILVYDLVKDGIQLTFPSGNEPLVPGETISIQWDSWGNSSSFRLEFSTDNGNSWQTIDASVAAAKRQYDWLVPAVATAKALVRITRNNDNKISIGKPFVILGVPTIALSAIQCPGHLATEWNAIPGATDYLVSYVKKGEMITIDSTVSTSYIFRNLLPDSVYWVAVRPRISNQQGRRSIAISAIANGGACEGTISDNDLGIQMLLYPLVGRKFTSNSLGNAELISARIKNNDNAPVTGFVAAYSVNNNPWVSSTSSLTIAAGGFVDYTFTTPYDFSNTGAYTVRVAVTKAGDVNRGNDTLVYLLRHVSNDPISLTQPYVENFNQAVQQIYSSTYMAMAGIERFDFIHEQGAGYIDFAQTPVFPSEIHGIFMYRPGPGRQELRATFNLANFDTALNRVMMSVNYSKLVANPNTGDKFWIRGSDLSPWIEVNLFTNPGGVLNNQVMFEITSVLRSSLQNFSSSFQVQWTQQSSNNDYVYDDIQLFDVSADAELVSINEIKTLHCGVPAPFPIKISVRNNGRLAISNLAVKYRIDGGIVQTGAIVNIDPNNAVDYTFSVPANLAVTGAHMIECWTELPGDRHLQNDRKSVTIHAQPAISAFPYLENFEAGDAHWYSDGLNNSWQFGTPASDKIVGAASGNKAWKTNLTGPYNNFERSNLYSGCFDLSGLLQPMISASVSLNMDSCSSLCDGARLQYSLNGTDWINAIPLQKQGFNWPINFRALNHHRWHVATASLPKDLAVVQLRFVFSSDHSIVHDGIGIDDIHIYDSTTGIHDDVTSNPVVAANTPNGQWKEFKLDGKILGAVKANQAVAGETRIKVFGLPTTPNFHGQYHLRRSFAVAPAPGLDSVDVRIYFTDAEADQLLFESNCNGCFKPRHAYQFGISTVPIQELNSFDGLVPSKHDTSWNFVPYSKLKTVPYQKGYYIECRIKGNTGIWLNSGGYDRASYLPTQIEEFDAVKISGDEARITWTTASNINLARFEIQVARGNTAFLQENYSVAGTVNSDVPSAAAQSYQFSDLTPGKEGVYFYRVKIIDQQGKFSYSRAVAVFFSNEYDWTINPNISNGEYQLSYQTAPDIPVTLNVYNSAGVTVKSARINGNGFINQYTVDLRSTLHAAGMYFIKVQAGKFEKVFRVVKH